MPKHNRQCIIDYVCDLTLVLRSTRPLLPVPMHNFCRERVNLFRSVMKSWLRDERFPITLDSAFKFSSVYPVADCSSGPVKGQHSRLREMESLHKSKKRELYYK